MLCKDFNDERFNESRKLLRQLSEESQNEVLHYAKYLLSKEE